MNENNNRPNKGRSIFKIFFFVFLAIFLVAAGMLIQRKIQEENAYNLLREMQEKANTEAKVQSREGITTAAAPLKRQEDIESERQVKE